MTDGSSVGYPGSSHTLSAGSPSGTSISLGMPPYGFQDGSMSSSQSISSSNSEKQSEDADDIEPPDRYAEIRCGGH